MREELSTGIRIAIRNGMMVGRYSGSRGTVIEPAPGAEITRFSASIAVSIRIIWRSQFNGRIEKVYPRMLTNGHRVPFLLTVFVVCFRRFDFNEHIIPVIFEAERSNLCGGHGNPTTRFDGVQIELCDGNWHCPERRRDRLDDGCGTAKMSLCGEICHPVTCTRRRQSHANKWKHVYGLLLHPTWHND